MPVYRLNTQSPVSGSPGVTSNLRTHARVTKNSLPFSFKLVLHQITVLQGGWNRNAVEDATLQNTVVGRDKRVHGKEEDTLRPQIQPHGRKLWVTKQAYKFFGSLWSPDNSFKYIPIKSITHQKLHETAQWKQGPKHVVPYRQPLIVCSIRYTEVIEGVPRLRTKLWARAENC